MNNVHKINIKNLPNRKDSLEMVTLCEYKTSPKLIVNNGLFTIVYILTLLAVLSYTNSIIKLGKLSSNYIIIILLLLDLIKSKYSGHAVHHPSSKSNIKKLLGLVIITVAFCFVIAIFYGAPVLSEHEETLMFALLTTVCTTCHSLIHMGVKGSLNVFGELSSFTTGISLADVTLRNVQLSIIGAWGFALFIPLDWDKPWQLWPIPCCIGVLLGYAVGHLLSICFVIFNKFCKSKRKKSCV